MQVIILAGGRGTRLMEETVLRPKPLVEVLGKPLIWHIMKHFSHFGFMDFIVATGYKGEQISEYFAKSIMYGEQAVLDFSTGKLKTHNENLPPWRIRIVNTGLFSGTAGRLAKVIQYVEGDAFITYGDGIADVDLSKLLDEFHSNNTMVTLTAVRPPARFGALDLEGRRVKRFVEKPQGDNTWINGGFLVCKKEFLSLNASQLSTGAMFETELLPDLALKGELSAYQHNGFWQPVDTIRDLELLKKTLSEQNIPWIDQES